MIKRIMIVDDMAMLRKILKEILIRHGYEVVGEAENGIEAVAKYILLKPDLVTMDNKMPEMNGIEALNKIIAIDPSAKIIMVSSSFESDLVNEALQNGAIDFVIKPFPEDRLLQAVKKALSIALVS